MPGHELNWGGFGQQRQVGQPFGQVTKRPSCQALRDAFAQLIAVEPAVEKVALELDHDVATLGITYPQIGARPESTCRIHGVQDICL